MNSLNLQGFAFLMLFSVLSGESQATIINGDFATGDLTGWTVSAIDELGNPIAPTPFISVIPVGSQNAAEFKTGEFVDGLFIATLEQTFLVEAANSFLTFEFNTPIATPDTTGTGTSPFFDGFFMTLDNGVNFFDLLLVDQFGALADPFGTAPGTTTLGASVTPGFDSIFTLNMTSLIGDDVTLFLDLINEDDGFQFDSLLISNIDATSASKTRPAPEPGIIWLIGIGGVIFIIHRHRLNNHPSRGSPVLDTAKYLSLMLFLILPLAPSTGYTQTIDRSDLNNVDAQTQIHYSSIFHNRRSRKSTTNAHIENTSGSAVDTPLILVVESISDPNVTVANADGTTAPDGKPYYDFSGQVPADTLDPAESTNTRPLVFNNPLRRRFNVQASVFEQTTAAPTPTVNLELPTDSQGRQLIPTAGSISLTVRADGTAPVTVDLGQTPAVSGSRGQVFFGDSGTDISSTVTTSGGSDNTAQVTVRGNPNQPSAFHGDLSLTAEVGGNEVANETVTVLSVHLDLETTTLINDMSVVRTINTTPATPGLTFNFDFFRGTMSENGGQRIDEAQTFNSVTISPLDGSSSLTTDSSGRVQFEVQAGYVGQGWVFGWLILPLPGIQFHYAIGFDLTQNANCCVPCRASTYNLPPCDYDCNGSEQDTCSFILNFGASGRAGGHVSLHSGGYKYFATFLTIEGRGFDYSLAGVYNSQASHLRPASTGDFAEDWALSYSDERLLKDGNNVVVFRPELRTDVFVASGTPGEYLAPIEFYEKLTFDIDRNIFELRRQDGMIKTFAGFDHPDIPGRLISMEDRNGNFMSFFYQQPAGLTKFVLTKVEETMGRAIQYRYFLPGEPGTTAGNVGRLKEVEDFRRDNSPAEGRIVRFDYDDEGNLAAATSPKVMDTPNDSNNFLVGKTLRFKYTQDSDIAAGVSGSDRQRQLHNMIAIEHPNEAAADLDPGNPQTLLAAAFPESEVINYGIDPSDSTNFDRVQTYGIGGKNEHGVPAGSSDNAGDPSKNPIQYSYEFVAPNAVTPNDPFLKTTVTDRRGNVTDYTYSPFDTLLEKSEFTRDLRSIEPDAFTTRFQWNFDKRLLQVTLPEGNVIDTTFDQNNADRFQQGNRLETVRTPDADRGGDQSFLAIETVYEPIYNQPAAMTDSRGIDLTFDPPIDDACGRPQKERYTTRNFFDYQEAKSDDVLPLLAGVLGISENEVQARLEANGILLGLGDLNGDGDIAPRVAGNIIRTVSPSVSLLPESNQQAVEGNACQEIVTLFRFNKFGQILSTTDPEGNKHQNIFFPENDPDGDGDETPPPMDGRILDPDDGGYLAEQIRDIAHLPGANSNSGTAPAEIHTQFERDDVGNTTGMRDGRDICTDFFVNELDQVVQTIRAACVPSVGIGSPPEAIDLVVFAYRENIFYDFNNNVTQREIEDRGKTSEAGDFVETVFKYDILDNLIEQTEEVGGGFDPLTTLHRYDRNENRVMLIRPAGNADSTVFDERDLLFQSIRGADSRPLEGLFGDNDPNSFNRPGGGGTESSLFTNNYDQNRNLIETVDAEDHGGMPPAIGGVGDASKMDFDGFDRRKKTTDTLGNVMTLVYDPASNVIRSIANGDPVDDVAGGGQNRTLAVNEAIHDELNRVIVSHRVLFQTPGAAPMRTPTLTDTTAMDGLVTYLADANGDTASVPGATGIDVIGRVSSLTEYDRLSRQTFAVQDDLDVVRSEYDGVSRVIRTEDSALDNGSNGGGFNPANLQGNIVETLYDDNNNPIERKEIDVGFNESDEIFCTTYHYDALDRLQSVRDNIGQAEDYRYDSRNNLVAKADAVDDDGSRAFPGRGLCDPAVATANQFGNVTRTFYDGINRTVQTEAFLTPEGIGNNSYIGANFDGEKIDPPGGYVDLNQSEDGRIVVDYAFDQNSQLLALRDDDGNTSAFIFDNQNRTLVERKGMNEGFQGTVFNITGGDTGMFFEVSIPPAKQDPPEETEAGNTDNGTSIEFSFDRDSNVETMINEGDVNGVRSTLRSTFDALNRRTRLAIENPAGSLFTGTTLQRFEFDGLSRMTRSFDNNQPGPGDDDVTVGFFYDSLSRKVEETQQIGNLTAKAVSTDYDIENGAAVGQGTTLIYPDGRGVDSTFDNLDRLEDRTDVVAGGASAIGTFAYIGKWRVTTLTYQNGIFLRNSYDDLRRIINRRWERVSNGSVIVGFEHQDNSGNPLYDRANNKRIEFKTHDAENSEQYKYDSLYRLASPEAGQASEDKRAFERGIFTDGNRDSMAGGVESHQDWDLDGLGNWTLLDDDGREETRKHSDFNEIVNRFSGGLIGGTSQLIHDKNGNTLDTGYKTLDAGLFPGGGLRIEYDALNRVRRIFDNGNTPGIDATGDDEIVGEYSYDSANRRFRKEVFNGGVVDDSALDGITDFYYEGWRVVEERDGGDAVTQQYVFGNYLDEVLVLDDRDGGVVSVADLNDGAGGDRHFYHSNTLYHIYALTDETDAMAEAVREYDAYGKVSALIVGPGADLVWFTSDDVLAVNPGVSGVGNPWFYTGQRVDGETSLMYYKYRYFSVDLGRFVSRDPVGYGAGINLYKYAFDNPIRWRDTLGLQPFTPPPLPAPVPIPPTPPGGQFTWDLYEIWRLSDLIDETSEIPTADTEVARDIVEARIRRASANRNVMRELGRDIRGNPLKPPPTTYGPAAGATAIAGGIAIGTIFAVVYDYSLADPKGGCVAAGCRSKPGLLKHRSKRGEKYNCKDAINEAEYLARLQCASLGRGFCAPKGAKPCPGRIPCRPALSVYAYGRIDGWFSCTGIVYYTCSCKCTANPML